MQKLNAKIPKLNLWSYDVISAVHVYQVLSSLLHVINIQFKLLTLVRHNFHHMSTNFINGI